MAFKATLKVDGKEYDILDCSYSLHRDVDHKGRPASETYGGQVNVSIETGEDNSFWEWTIDNVKHKDVEIIWFKRDDVAELKKMTLSTCYLIGYSESFSSVGGQPMVTNLSFSAKEIGIGGATHENDWVM